MLDVLDSLHDFFAEMRRNRYLFGSFERNGVEVAALDRNAPCLFKEQGIGGKLEREVWSRLLFGIFVLDDDALGVGGLT